MPNPSVIKTHLSSAAMPGSGASRTASPMADSAYLLAKAYHWLRPTPWAFHSNRVKSHIEVEQLMGESPRCLLQNIEVIQYCERFGCVWII